MDQEFGDIIASDDGTFILNKLKLEDTMVNMGVKVVQEASAKTNTDQGDGTTTTATILRELANSLLKEDSQEELLFKKNSGNNLQLRKDINAGVDKVISYLDENRVEATSKEQLSQIGRVSANDSVIGDMLGDMFYKLGKSGAVTISDGTGLETTSEIIEGMSFDQGWLAQQFITDYDREEAVLEAGETPVNVLVANIKIQDIEHIKKIGELFQNDNINDLLIIADDISGVPLNTLVANKMQQVLRTVAVKAPQLGNQSDILQDICAVTGATLIGGADGIEFKDLEVKHLGKAKKAVVSKSKTIILGTKENKSAVEERVSTLEGRRKKEESEYEKKNITERISKLTGGVGTIKIGGATPLEVKDRKAKVTDAVNAVRSALKGGVVPGGGLALLLASQVLNDDNEGEKILKNAIQKPYKQILENSDLEVDSNVEKSIETGHGIDVETEKFGDLVAAGIIDPANVVRTTLQNAVSSALMVSNLGGGIAVIRDKDNKND